jgi:hypothetical protein
MTMHYIENSVPTRFQHADARKPKTLCFINTVRHSREFLCGATKFYVPWLRQSFNSTLSVFTVNSDTQFVKQVRLFVHQMYVNNIPNFVVYK